MSDNPKKTGFDLCKTAIEAFNRVDELVEECGKAETSFLEFKAGVYPKNPRNEDKDEVFWNVAKAVLGLINHDGGCVLIGINDKADPVPLVGSDGTICKLPADVESLCRKTIDRLQQSSWIAKRKSDGCIIKYEIKSPLTDKDFELRRTTYLGNPIIAILVKPAEFVDDLVNMNEINQGKKNEQDWRLVRKQGDVGNVVTLKGYTEIKVHDKSWNPCKEQHWHTLSKILKRTSGTAQIDGPNAPTFPNEDFVLILCSKDVRDYAELVKMKVDEAFREEDDSTRGFVLTAGMYVPGVLDDYCRGVIAIQGEHVAPSKPSSVGGESEWSSWFSGGYGLEADWPERPEDQRNLLSENRMPYTESVDYLLQAQASTNCPATIFVLSDREIEEECRKQVKFNGQRMLNEHPELDSEEKRSEFYLNEYGIWRNATINLALGLRENESLPSMSTVHNEAGLIDSVRRFVSEDIFGREYVPENPYRFLAHYTSEKGDDLVGREKLSEEIVGFIEKRFLEKTRPALARLTGPSGCGKSSVLGGGVVHEYKKKHVDKCFTCEMRPDSFSDDSGHPKNPVASILEILQDCMPEFYSGKIDRDIRKLLRSVNPAPYAAVELLRAHLEEWDKALVLGIDQFEEIIDDIEDSDSSRDWQPLLEFIGLASQSWRIAIVVTIEDSREDKSQSSERIPEIISYCEEFEVSVDRTLLKRVIMEPFGRYFPLKEEVVTKLLEACENLRKKGSRNVAILPLLSLKLSELFEDFSQEFEPVSQSRLKLLADEKDRFPPKVDQFDYKLEGLINDTAENALKRATPQELDSYDTDYLLSPILGSQRGAVQLRDATLDGMYESDYMRLKELADSRLLTRSNSSGREQVRLTHEAVLHSWTRAREWFDSMKDYFKIEENARRDSTDTALSLEAMQAESIEIKVKEAATILVMNLRNWTLRVCPKNDESLLLYCKNVFSKSKTPLETVTMDGRGSHVSLAAAYDIVPLLERFAKQDPECLGRIPEKSKSQPLWAAAWNSPDSVEYLLTEIEDPIAVNEDKWPAVSCAIRHGNYRNFALLMEAAWMSVGESVKELHDQLVLPEGQSLLHYAANFCNPDNSSAQILNDLQENYGYRSTFSSDAEWLPIHHSAWFNNLYAFSLLEKQKGFDRKTKAKKDVVDLASENNSLSVLEHIFETPCFREQIKDGRLGRDAIYLAAQHAHPSALKLLLKEGLLDPNKVSKGNLPPLFVLIYNVANLLENKGRKIEDILDAIKILIRNNEIKFKHTEDSDSEAKPTNILTVISCLPIKNTYRKQIARLILSHPSIDLLSAIDDSERTGLSIAVEMRLFGPLKSLLRSNEVEALHTIDGLKNAVIHVLAKEKSLFRQLKALLPLPANTKDAWLNEKGQSPFELAVSSGNWPAVEHLFQDPIFTIHTFSKETMGAIIPVSVFSGIPSELLSRLVETHPALLIQSDFKGWTLLHLMCYLDGDSDSEEYTQFYPNNHFAWEIKDKAGHTPAYYAGRNRRASLPYGQNAQPVPEPPSSWDHNLMWSEPSAESKRAILAQLSEWKDESLPIVPSVEVHLASLPFYEDPIQLLRLSDPKWEGAILYFLYNGERFSQLNGSSPPIHEANAGGLCRQVEDGIASEKTEKNDPSEEASPFINLNLENAADYLRFFCFFVRGKEGPFFIFEDVDMKEVPDGFTHDEYEKLSELARPAAIVQDGEDFRAFGFVYYYDALFAADFLIEQGGMVRMIDDHPIEADLTCKIDCPITYSVRT